MKTKLFLIPYALVDRTVYDPLCSELRRLLQGEIDMFPVELRGHGSRRNEPLYESIDDAVSDVTDFIRKNSGDADEVYIYGHCIGGIIAYNIYMRQNVTRDPFIRKIILGSVGVNLNIEHSYEGFYKNFIKGNIEQVLHITSRALLEEVYELYRPILQREYDLVVSSYSNGRFVFDSNIVMINGDEDAFFDAKSVSDNVENYEAVKQYMVAGDHFFLNKSCGAVAGLICNEITLA